MDQFMKTVNSFKLGDPEDASTYIGPVTRSAQILQIKSQIRDAVSKGAKLLTGGDRADRKGFYLEPTVLADVNHSMEVMREESFGPVIGIMQVSSDEEATRLMNETTYGLTAGVYSSNRSRAEKILSKIDAGTVYWNCCDRVSPRLPWTGRKHSGIGSTLSRIGIQAFVQPRAWHLRSPS
ncbi:MAG TPA: aldehyde dehydrogenase family protein, partial [Leptospiraceae bacterium]|nr:aldehyde dehydrogenase family protein [Leptospiraceae bacterium]